MPRHILRTFVERALLAALPLAACGGDEMPPPQDLAAIVDFAPTCENAHPPQILTLSAQFADGGQPSDCYIDGPCAGSCATGYDVCCVLPADNDGGAGPLRLACFYDCDSIGRRPSGLEPAAPFAACVLGTHWGHMAHLEAASVHAFRRLARELAQHDAPAALRRDALRAARDESRHARVTARLARAHRVRPPRVVVAAEQPRALVELAVENATEGCVGETFGALVASWQARHAADAGVRRALGGIARDEVEHAELAWAVDGWAMRRLGRVEQRRVREARGIAVAALDHRLREPAPALRVSAGLPSLAVARQLAASARAALWS